MALILDSSGVPSAIDADQRFHQAAKEALERAVGPLVLSPFVLAELGYMVLTRYGASEELTLLGEVKGGAYRLELFSTEDVAKATEIIERHAGFGDVGLADASNVVPAERYATLGYSQSGRAPLSRAPWAWRPPVPPATSRLVATLAPCWRIRPAVRAPVARALAAWYLAAW